VTPGKHDIEKLRFGEQLPIRRFQFWPTSHNVENCDADRQCWFFSIVLPARPAGGASSPSLLPMLSTAAFRKYESSLTVCVSNSAMDWNICRFVVGEEADCFGFQGENSPKAFLSRQSV
jgi:hypothetical protein